MTFLCWQSCFSNLVILEIVENLDLLLSVDEDVKMYNVFRSSMYLLNFDGRP